MAWAYRKHIKTVPHINLTIGQHRINSTIVHPVPGSNAGITDPDRFANPRIKPSKSETGFVLYRHLYTIVETGVAMRNFPDLTADVFIDTGNVICIDLQNLKDIILAAHRQRVGFLKCLKMAQGHLYKNELKLSLSYKWFYGFLLKKRIRLLKSEILSQKKVILTLEKEIIDTVVKLNFEFDHQMNLKYSKLCECFESLSGCKDIWNITSENPNDLLLNRSSASNNSVGIKVSFRSGHLPDIKSETAAMIWVNGNGSDIYFYPSFIVVWNNRKHFSIVAYDEFEINFTAAEFIETEQVLSDMRLKANHKISTVKYGVIELKTGNSLNVRYLFSNFEHANAFYLTFLEYQIAINN